MAPSSSTPRFRAEAFRKRPGFDKVKNLVTIDATAIALQELGANIVNTIMMGAAVGGTDLVTPEAMGRRD